MAFLTKKEQATISLIRSVGKTDTSASEMVSAINLNAKLRSFGYRKPVKVFLSVITKHQNNQIINKIKK